MKTDSSDALGSIAAPVEGGLKLNLGCGLNKLDGYVNVDAFPGCEPDLIWDLERTPWPFDDDSVGLIHANHVLEHLGQARETFFAIVKELYRVVRHGGELRINVPHPLHMNYLTDPTHVRCFTTDTFRMLSRRHNLDWMARKANITLLAIMLDVDFEPLELRCIFAAEWQNRVRRGELSVEQLAELSQHQFGVVSEIRTRLRVNKSHRVADGGPDRSVQP